MYIPDIELHEPTTLREASELMARFAPDSRLMAGGTDLLVDLKSRRVEVRHVVSINRITKLRGISRDETGLRIGALTSISELDRSQHCTGPLALLRDATSQMAAVQVRNAATVGGNIAGAVPCADLPPVFAVLGAAVLLWSPRGERTVAVEDVFADVRRTTLDADEVLTAVLIPDPPSGFGGAYARFALRDGNAMGVAGVAAGLVLDDDGRVVDARIAMSSVAPTTRLSDQAAQLLVGRLPDAQSIQSAAEAAKDAAEPISDVRGSAEYRRELVGILAGRALAGAVQRAGE